MALIICPECGKRFSEFAESCPQCGFPTSEIPMSIECPECGNQYPQDMESCPNCGFPTSEIPLSGEEQWEAMETQATETNRGLKEDVDTTPQVPYVFFSSHKKRRKRRKGRPTWIIAAVCLAGLVLLLYKTNNDNKSSNSGRDNNTFSTQKSDINKNYIYGLWRCITKIGNSELEEELLFNRDGTGSIRTSYKEYTSGYITNYRTEPATAFKWEVSGNQIIIIYGGERTPEFRYVDGKLIDSGGNTFIK